MSNRIHPADKNLNIIRCEDPDCDICRWPPAQDRVHVEDIAVASRSLQDEITDLRWSDEELIKFTNGAQMRFAPSRAGSPRHKHSQEAMNYNVALTVNRIRQTLKRGPLTSPSLYDLAPHLYPHGILHRLWDWTDTVRERLALWIAPWLGEE